MHKILITGDQKLDPNTAFTVVMKLAARILTRSVEEGIPMSEIQFVTGDSPTGIERAVRYLYADYTPLIVVNYPRGHDGEIDYESGLRSLDVEAVVVIDDDPLDNPIAAAVTRAFDGRAKIYMPLVGQV